MDPPQRISLSHIPHVWRAESLLPARGGIIATGHESLDGALGGGWPSPALIEVLCDQEGIGELQLLRALWQPRSMRACNEERRVVLWLNAPCEVHAVALAQLGLDPAQHWYARGLSERDALWAMEQALRSGSCALVMAWSKTVTPGMLRRLKLAASSHDSLAVLVRPCAAAAAPSPATLRLRLQPRITRQESQLQVDLLKVQGRRPGSLLLPLHGRTQRVRAGPPA
jgi:protein ImuA